MRPAIIRVGAGRFDFQHENKNVRTGIVAEDTRAGASTVGNLFASLRKSFF